MDDFSRFIEECKTHYRLIPLLEIMEEDPEEWARLKYAFQQMNKHDLIDDLYTHLDYLDHPRQSPHNQLTLF